MLAIVLLSSLALAPQDAESARDAYLEGWFQETAEGNLEAALRAYRSCVERGGEGDAALVAKAKLRMARIAGARGDREAERSLLLEVVERYAGSPAAEEARLALEAPEAASPPSTPTAAVAEAQAFLDEMLKDQSRVTAVKVEQVFRTLSTAEILDRLAVTGGTLSPILGHLTDEAKLWEIVRSAPDPTVERALQRLRDAFPTRPVPPEVLAVASRLAPSRAWDIAEHLARSGQMDALRNLLEQHEGLRDAVGGRAANVVQRMVERGDAPAADVVETIVGWMAAADLNLTERIDRAALGADDAVGERLRALFSTWPVEQRNTMAHVAFAHARQNGASRPLLDLLLEDPEPILRWLAITLLMESSDRERRREGFERFASQPRPLEVGGLIEFVNQRGQDHWRETIELVPAGALRECVYSSLLWASHRTPAEVVAVGLERGDPELVTAMFRPRWWRDEDIRLHGRAPTPPSAHMPRGILVHVPVRELHESFAAHPDPSLAVRLADAALASPDEQVRRGIVGLVSAPPDDPRFRAVADRVAADPSAAIRRFALVELGFEAFGPATREALLLDEDALIRPLALQRCFDPAALAAAGQRADAATLLALASRALQLEATSAVAALYPKIPPNESVAAQALRFLADHDLDVVLAGLDRGDPLPSPVSRAARDVALDLPLPADLSQALEAQPTEPAAIRAQAELLRSRRADVEAAFRARGLANVRTLALSPSSSPSSELLARRLADLGGKDLALDLVRLHAAFERAGEVGGLALAALGETELLRTTFLETPYPFHFVVPALAAGLDEDILAAVETGRLEPITVLKKALEAERKDLVAAVLVGPASSPRRVHLDPNVPTQPIFSAAIDHLTQEKDVPRLATLVLLYDQIDAARALLHLEAYDALLADLPSWSPSVRSPLLEELRRRTSYPETTTDWPPFAKTQHEWIDEWKRRLD